MSFKNLEPRNITIDHEDEEYIYFADPAGVRVHKITHLLQRIDRHKRDRNVIIWVDCCLYPIFKGGYLVIGAMNKLYNAGRLLATAFLPNPEGFKYVGYKDHNYNNISLDNIYWRENISERSELTRQTDPSVLKENLEGLTAHSKEYHKIYNSLKGSDGLTHSERYHKFYKDMGLVLCPKKYSPTGRAFYCYPDLRIRIKNAFKDGSIDNKEVKDLFLKEIASQPRKNKTYKIKEEN